MRHFATRPFHIPPIDSLAVATGSPHSLPRTRDGFKSWYRAARYAFKFFDTMANAGPFMGVMFYRYSSVPAFDGLHRKTLRFHPATEYFGEMNLLHVATGKQYKRFTIRSLRARRLSTDLAGRLP